MDDIDEIIREVLRPLGITRNYRGYPQVVCAVALAMEDETRLAEVTKTLYPVAAERTGSKSETVERNLRTAVLRAWRVNRALLDQMAKYHLMAPPCVSGFIDIVATYIQRDLLGPASAKL